MLTVMKNDKHQQAYTLYFQTDLTQVEIAKLLDVDRRTVHNWLKEGNWRQLKKSAQHIPSKLVEQFYYMLANLNQEILGRPQQPYPLTHEVEQLRKLCISIRHLKNRQTINENIESFTNLAEVISYKDPELAQQLRPHIQSYIKNRADFKLADSMMDGYQCDPSLGEMFDYEIRPEDDDTANPGDPGPGDPSTTVQPTPGNTPAPVPSHAPIPVAA
jgi:predicted DNA-binding protein YlxM (UPF0122 family)